jgi:hypothetical protein
MLKEASTGRGRAMKRVKEVNIVNVLYIHS